jgi:hypothetical protein
MKVRDELMQHVFVSIVLGLLLTSCYCAPGAQPTRSSTADVLVFDDANLNGTWEEGEIPIPDVLVIRESNLHGDYTRATILTSDRGRATVSASYTHFFVVGVLPPCGYTPTSDTSVQMHDEGRHADLAFGFRPIAPQTGMAELHFSVWHDLNRDGVRQDGEPPLSGIEARVNLHLGWWTLDSSFGSDDSNDLVRETDEEGRAVLELGNSCGTLWVVEPPGWQTTVIEPAGHWEEGEMELIYYLGRTEIDWGLSRVGDEQQHPRRPAASPRRTLSGSRVDRTGRGIHRACRD